MIYIGYYASKIIELAKAEVGYLEKKTNSQLDSKTANAGFNNYTKYAKDLYEAGYYNGNKNGYAWCDVFVDWLFFKAFGKQKGQEIECQTGVYGASCTSSCNYYKAQGRFDKKPKIGDQIFFTNKSGSIAHTGIVVDVSDRIYTIEGNTSSASGVVANGGCVAAKSYPLNYSRIYGYGHPKYDEEPGSSKPTPAPVSKGGECSVTLPVLRYGCKGSSVKALQILLIGNGYSCGSAGADASFGPSTKSAVGKYQKEHGLVVDYEVGPATWGKLLK